MALTVLHILKTKQSFRLSFHSESYFGQFHRSWPCSWSPPSSSAQNAIPGTPKTSNLWPLVGSWPTNAALLLDTSEAAKRRKPDTFTAELRLPIIRQLRPTTRTTLLRMWPNNTEGRTGTQGQQSPTRPVSFRLTASLWCNRHLITMLLVVSEPELRFCNPKWFLWKKNNQTLNQEWWKQNISDP